MPSYLHPGVYVEEIPSGSRPIEGVATSVTAFVGFADRGPVGEPVLIGNFDDYQNAFGPISSEDDHMGLAVQAFYLNGGGSAYICRLAGDVQTAENETDILGEGSYDPGTNSRSATPTAVLEVHASSPGEWGNELRFQITKDARDSRLFSLAVGHLGDGEFVEDERFDNLSMVQDADDFVETVVNASSSLVTVSVVADSGLYEQAKLSGGVVQLTDVQAYLGVPANSLSFSISANGSTFKTATLAGVDGSSDETAVAGAMQDAIRTALGTDAIDVTQSFSSGEGFFRIDTTGTANSKTALQIIDSSLVETLGLSSQNRAIVTGGDAGASPSVAADSGFQLTLDQYDTMEVVFASGVTGGASIADEIQRQVRAHADAVTFSGFTCTFDGAANSFTLRSGGSDVLESAISLAANASAATDARTALALDSATPLSGRTTWQGIDQVVPQEMLGISPAPGLGERLIDGQDTLPVAADFTSFYNTTLRKYRDVSILVLPGSSWDGDTGQANIAATLAHCESMKNRMLILDPPRDTELENATVVSGLGLPTSTYTTLYYPWVSMANPLYHPDKAPTADKTVPIPPSAIAAGMWAKIDGKRGVWKAPAGVEARVTGASSLQYQVENLEQDQLNPLGVNCIRTLPNYGSVFWGARTLATKADPEWRYVPVRRTAIYIEESIYNGIQWAVFEPNAHPLWSSLRANIGAFMNGLFRAGAFQGETAKSAYFVRCGLGDTMTQGDIDRGQVIVIVGFAPLKPAEFVIVRIQQKVGEES